MDEGTCLFNSAAITELVGSSAASGSFWGAETTDLSVFELLWGQMKQNLTTNQQKNDLKFKRSIYYQKPLILKETLIARLPLFLC